MSMSREHFVEGRSSYGPDTLTRLDQGSRVREHRMSVLKEAYQARGRSSEAPTPSLTTLLNDQRGGHRLVAALGLGLATLLLGGGAVAKVFMDNNSARAAVVTPVDLGLGAKVVDNPPVGVGGGEPPLPPDTAPVASASAPAPELATNPENIPQENIIQRLAVYGVYHGNLLDETNKPIGEVSVTRLPDHERRGRQVWVRTHITEPCSNGHRLAPSETLSERYIKGDEIVSDFRPRAIKVRVPNQSIVSGELLLRAVGVCPAEDLNTHFEIPFVGQGLDVLTRDATAMNQRLGVTATPEFIRQGLEAAYGGPLPAVVPYK